MMPHASCLRSRRRAGVGALPNDADADLQAHMMKQIRQAEANLRRLETARHNNPPREQRVATLNAEMLKMYEDYKRDGSIVEVSLAGGSAPGEGPEHTDLAIRAAH